MVLGTLVGLAIGFGLFLVRRAYWESLRFAVKIGAALIGCLLVMGVVLLVGGSSKGGDAGMAAIVVLIFGGAACLLALLISLAAGALQAKRLNAKSSEVGLSLLADMVLLVIAFAVFQDQVTNAQRKALSNQWLQSETARRQSVEDLRRQIPPQYRGMSSQMIGQMEEQQRQLREMGHPSPRVIPAEVAQAIREYERAQLQTPVPANLTSYAEIQQNQNDFWRFMLGSWAVAAFLMPLCVAGRPKAD